MLHVWACLDNTLENVWKLIAQIFHAAGLKNEFVKEFEVRMKAKACKNVSFKMNMWKKLCHCINYDSTSPNSI